MKTACSPLSVFLVLCFVLSCNGCILVPFIDGAKQTGILQGDRERLLQEELTQFNRTRFWGKPMQALAFAAPESRETMQDFLRKHSKDQRVVESEVDFIDFSEDSYRAEVSARVKYYRVPYYIVQERIENQDWTFSVASGWKVANVEVQTR